MKRLSPRKRKIIAAGVEFLQSIGLHDPVMHTISNKRLTYTAIGKTRAASRALRNRLNTSPCRERDASGAIIRTFSFEDGVVKMKHNPASERMPDNERIVTVEFYKE